MPFSLQTIDAERIAKHAGTDLPSLLQRELGGVDASNGQNNPWQPDLSFRGFDASPLLGTPEALSVYVEGARVNEPFGDVVNFDLIPMAAIAQVALIPGSNPIYGLNTLGVRCCSKRNRVSTLPELPHPPISVRSVRKALFCKTAVKARIGAGISPATGIEQRLGRAQSERSRRCSQKAAIATMITRSILRALVRLFALVVR